MPLIPAPSPLASRQNGRSKRVRAAPLKTVLREANELHRELLLLDAADLAAIFAAAAPAATAGRPAMPGGTRLHALGEAETFLSSLVAVSAWGQDGQARDRRKTSGPTSPISSFAARPAIKVHEAVDGMRDKSAAICAAAGLGTPEAQAASHSWVRRVALYLTGVAGHVFGKARRRRLSKIGTTAARLSQAITRLISGPAPAQGAASATIPTAILCALGPLLGRLRANAADMVAASPGRAPGRAEVPDPIRFGAEGVLAIWLRHHPSPPTLSRNRGRFLVFGQELLNLCAEAQGTARPGWLHSTTFVTALRAQVIGFRQKVSRG